MVGEGTLLPSTSSNTHRRSPVPASKPSIRPEALTTISSPDGASAGVLQETPGSRSVFHWFFPVTGSNASRYE